ncbi:hypothetical protein HML84_02160 [Alcanivorax sp. IO_7]|nr:hypothetical protein HML84_02160 [Alcanivorax sp. IO_7]
MLNKARRWFEDRKLARLPVDRDQWEEAVARWPVATRYEGAQRDRLFDMALRFLVRKELASGGGFQLDDGMSLLIATMAVVPVLELGLDWYDGWYTVIVYEDTFVTPEGRWTNSAWSTRRAGCWPGGLAAGPGDSVLGISAPPAPRRATTW